jgi:hypothetical protein
VLTSSHLEITVPSQLVICQFGYGVFVIDPPARQGFWLPSLSGFKVWGYRE